MAYIEERFDEAENEAGNIFANVIRIGGNILSAATDTIDGYATPQQGKTTILKMLKEIEQKLEGIKE